MDVLERRSVAALATVYLFRMLGLFLIMPVISLAADDLNGANAALIGAAIGIYGLTQALLQIPMGMLSDRLGRKRIIVIGLILFALGSILCAQADDIMSLIVGRAIQGAGAIASTLMALLSDVTREQNRTKAMATVGISIGVSFMLSLVLGPKLYAWIGLSGLFYLSLASSLIGIALIIWVVPNHKQHTFQRDTTPSLSAFARVWHSSGLRHANISVLLLHASLTALFVCIPTVMVERLQLPVARHSYVYLVVMGLAFVGMLPLVIMAEARHKMKAVMVFAFLLLGATAMFMLWSSVLWLFALLLWGYFVAFNTLEATLPSIVSKLAPVGYRGTAMGFFSTHQFFGAFLGGMAGGWVSHVYGETLVFYVVGTVLCVWGLVSLRQPAPRHLTSLAFSLANMNQAAINTLAAKLTCVQGVEDMQLFADEQTAYLKIDKQRLDKAQLLQIVPHINL